MKEVQPGLFSRRFFEFEDVRFFTSESRPLAPSARPEGEKSEFVGGAEAEDF